MAGQTTTNSPAYLPTKGDTTSGTAKKKRKVVVRYPSGDEGRAIHSRHRGNRHSRS